MVTATTCRRAAADACASPGAANSFLNTAVLTIRAGDILDFGISWAAFCAANHAKIKSSTWAAAAGSPVAPTFVASSQLIGQDTHETTVLLDATGLANGNALWLQNTVVFEKAADSPVVYLDRTIIRRLLVGVVTP